MRLLLLLLGMITLGSAAPRSLGEIMNHVDRDHPLLQVLKADLEAARAGSEARYGRQPLQLAVEGSRAEPETAKAGGEYSLSLEQEWMLPGAKSNLIKSEQAALAAREAGQKRRLLELKYRIAEAYHTACLDDENRRMFEKAYETFEALYEKKRKAYELGELSKKELLQLRMERLNLQRQQQAYRTAYATASGRLASLAAWPELAETPLECSDRYPVMLDGSEQEGNFSLSLEAIDRGIESAAFEARRHEGLPESVGLALRFDSELDTERYTVGVRLPLEFTSGTRESRRVAALRKKSALEYGRTLTTVGKGAERDALLKKLDALGRSIATLSQTLQGYEEELMPLVEQSYALGESSAIEYLLSRRERWRWQNDLTETKKQYYNALFAYYSLTEKEL